MNGNRLTKLSLAIGLSVATTSALASPQQFMSSRSFAMAGTGVAVSSPVEATAKNPALMAGSHHEWSDDFGLILPSVNARAADEEETVDQVDDIQDTIDALEVAINNTDQAEAQKQAGILRDQLQAFDRDTVRVNAGLGLALAFPRKDLSVGVFTNGNLTATVRGEYDQDDDATLQAIENGALVPGATDNLESRGKVLASAVAEVGIAFAREFELSNGEKLQLGVSPKYVNLQTFQYTETVSGFEDDDFDSDESQTDKSGFNLDLGAAYSFGEEQEWTVGAAVKNLIPMELDSAASRPALGEEVRTLKLDPMLTVGIAHRSDYHVVTAEVDLTKKEAFGYEDDTQWLALGAEFDAWRYAQLRVGVRQNLASNDDNNGIEEKTQFTAGFGLNIVGVRLDLGALYSDADVGAALELGTAF
ncbi:MAG: type IX secretion system membrane protein PorP/SprF [Gammaproteobacteria bacterium]|uniref:IncI1 plasmid conjugative transfer protein TraF n=1 Tax=Marinobacter nitratireducens TaxID=1137280 RepID=A0A072NBP5_9GAMM|nr:conjugal transfer protein TraF [Marinobacter nitratireducens]KEF30500.1 IncI1 plasmid conjugative transfer protein TraF [Marinobacter nitratireducens]TNE72370.1 MAG: type IX secretion system membrane protein PorP/SprF [Gammaproteobacteria bacterium]